MKKQIIFLAVAALMAAGTSCDKQETDDLSSNERIPVQFSAQESMLRTADAGGGATNWVANDPIGIFMLTAGATTIAEASDNRRYLATPGSDAKSAAFAPSEVNQTIYYPSNQAQQVDFIAYYPHKTGISNYVYPVNVSDQSNPSALDILWSNNAKNKNASNPAVNLTFEHQLAQFTIQVVKSSNTGGADFRNLTAVIEGMPVSASLSLVDGSLSNLVTGSFNAKKVTSSTDNATFGAVVIPNNGTTNPGRIVTFTLGDARYKWTIPDTETFAKGSQYSTTITLTLSDTGSASVKLDKTGWSVEVSDEGNGEKARIIDGNVDIDNYWQCNAISWIIIDMKEPVNVNKIVTVRGRKWGNSHTKTLNYFIGNSSDPDGIWTPIGTSAYNVEGGTGVLEDDTRSIDIAPVATGQYLKLLLDDSFWQQYHQIGEIDVYGSK